MMRNDDIDDIDLSRHRPSRLPGMLVIGAAVGVAVIAAWIVTPILMSKDSAATASLLSAPKVRAAAPKDQTKDQTRDLAPTLAAAAATPAAPAADTTAVAAPDEPAPAAAAATETTASTPWNAQPWPQSRGVQVAAAPPATPPAEADTTRLAAVAPQDTPAEPVENVPLPRKRPSRLIAASLVIPLPRPRPEIEGDAPAGPTAFDLQVERMR
jgi:hypothetical protein